MGGILLLAFFVEGLIEYLFGKDNETQPILKYVALLIGVLLAVAYNVDILAMVGLHSIVPLIGNVVSGVIIGRGSNYVNDFVGKLRRG